MAAEQLHGRLSSRIGEIRQALIRFLAHLEANLDFVEEDIPGFSRAAMQRELKTINGRVNELLVTSLRGRLLRDGVRVAIVGRPNVGKSSLFNALLASERAIVTNVPGTTRDVLEEKIEWDGVSIVLFDTAGLRSTKNAVEKEGTRRARRASAQADVVLYVLDASRSIPINDRHALKELSGKTVILVMNKSDKPNRIKNVSSFEPYATIKTSAIKRTGLSSLRKAVVSAVAAHAGPARHETGVVVTNQRHVEALEKAQKLLDEAIRAIASGRSEEALSVFVRQALEAIGTITGEAVTEDVLSAIFARFCVGK
jgi:tRNA modification GTPase